MFGDRQGALVALDPLHRRRCWPLSKPFRPNLFVDGIDAEAGRRSTGPLKTAAEPGTARTRRLKPFMAMAACKAASARPAPSSVTPPTFGGPHLTSRNTPATSRWARSTQVHRQISSVYYSLL
jgi:hypothetical protein